MTFQLPDEHWSRITRELQRLGRLESPGDRTSIENMCGIYVEQRARGVKGKKPSPKRAAEAWQGVALAAERLAEAIDALPDAGASEFGIIDNFGPATAAFRANLPGLAARAREVSVLEAYAPKVANRPDMLRDGLVLVLVRFWQERGGKLGASTSKGKASGPLIRFLGAVFDAVCGATGEKAPKPDALRGSVRKFKCGD